MAESCVELLSSSCRIWAAVGPLALVSVRVAAPQTALATAAGSSTAVPVVCIVAPIPALALCEAGTVNVTDVPDTTEAMV